MFIMIDNYDSFTYNLVQYFGQLEIEMKVFRNDKVSIKEIIDLNPTAVIISPGPCTPSKAGISVDLIKEIAPTVPLLGVCLGHQAIGKAFGAKIEKAQMIMHGKTSEVKHNNTDIFSGIKNPMIGGRYHSLVISRDNLPDCLEITAECEDDNTIMGIRHKKYKVFGIQFHPESILTPSGKRILKKFIEITG